LAPTASEKGQGMPKIVNHDTRRAEIVAAAAQVVARVGLEATTVRAIAAEAGYSSGVLDHYFHGKDDILLQALQASHRGIHERLRVQLRGRRGLDALRAMLLDNLPVDPQRLSEARLEIQFWARSLADPVLTQVQVRESGTFRGAIERYLHEAVADGVLAAAVNVKAEAQNLQAFVDGLSVHAAVDPARLTARLQAQLLDRELAGLDR